MRFSAPANLPAPLLFAAAIVALASLAAPLAAQGVPPDGDWRTFDTEHFRVTFQADLEPVARHAAAVAERTHAVLVAELTEPPAGPIDLVVTDHADYSNGFATPLPSNRITVYARPPLSVNGLGYTRDWIELVVAHELVHIFHLDRTSPLGHAVRTVFGRVPFTWPVFPVIGTPPWSLEGLATHYESRLTGAGRVHGSFHDMVIRTAALEAEIPELGDVTALSPVWPGGHRVYIYGSEFMDWIARTQGEATHRRLIDATADSWLPPFLWFDRLAREPLGASFEELYDRWREEAAASAQATVRRVRTAGVTTTERVAGRGPFAVAPRVSPDGGRLAYSADDYRSSPATRVVDLSTGRVRTLSQRNAGAQLLGPASWLPDGSALVVAQLEHDGPYRIWSDLWLLGVDGEERRLTDDERLAQPAVAPDGRRVAAIQAHRGGLRLVIHDLEAGTTRTLMDTEPGDGFDSPRWSPDGRRLAVTRFADGRQDLVMVDAETGEWAPVTDDAALDRSPVWTPDGEWILFSSDRTGVPNIFAAAAPAREAGSHGWSWDIRQVTDVLTGAFDPEPSPDGRTLFMSVYHNDGWHIERMPLVPGEWRAAPSPTLEYREGVLSAAVDTLGQGHAHAQGESRPYSPWPTLRPHFWLPSYWSVGGPLVEPLRFVGAYSFGWDVLQRHSWEAGAAVDVHTGRIMGDVSWTWRGLGNPRITAGARRDWEASGSVEMPDGSLEGVLRREDRVHLDALLLRQRWRRSAWLRLSAEAEWLEFEGRALSDEELRQAGIELSRLNTVGLSLGPGFTTADLYPFSISYEDGMSASAGVGRWWRTDAGANGEDAWGHAYDELLGRASGYLALPLGGFARPVLAARVAGLYRDGPTAAPTSIGGLSGELSLDVGSVGTISGDFLPVRGFSDGVRVGTRAWTAAAELRFPIHMPGAPPHAPRPGPQEPGIFGLSVTSLHGVLFADAGDAWCADDEPLSCTTGGAVVSAGAELGTTTGILQNALLQLRGGVAVRLRGPSPGRVTAYLAFGPSF